MIRVLSWVWPLALTAVLGTLVYFGAGAFLNLLYSGLASTSDPEKSGGQEVLLQLRALACTGGLGGFVSGFIQDRRILLRQYPVEGLPQIEFGALADVVTGIAGAWGVFFILARTLSLATKPEDVLTLIGLGVASGFGAKSLLTILGQRVENILKQAKEVASATAVEVAGAEAKERGKQAEDYSDAHRILALADLSRLDPDRADLLLKQAEDDADQILKKDPNSAQVMVALARVRRRESELVHEQNERLQKLKDARELCSKAIELRSDLEWAYYNRACYKALLDEPAQSVAEDVRKAIGLLPENKALFSNDNDLQRYWDKPEIRQLLE